MDAAKDLTEDKDFMDALDFSLAAKASSTRLQEEGKSEEKSADVGRFDSILRR